MRYYAGLDVSMKETFICIVDEEGERVYVPTLIDFFKALDLQKVASKDKATEESMVPFMSKLAEDKEKILQIVQREWGKVVARDIASTPAHQALAHLIELLRNEGKDVFAYTDNIDRIHKKTGIQLSEEHIPEEGITRILYPPINKIGQKKMTVLACGQSFDFHGILSTIYSRKDHAQEMSFFSLNIHPSSIAIYEGLDVEKALESSTEGVDISQFPVKSLDMLHIPGSLHQTLPELYERFKSS